MTAGVFAAVALAGGLGAMLRFVVDGLLRPRLSATLPWPTLLINASGSLVLGLLTGLALRAQLSADWAAILGVGLLGGYTTFSTASYETVRLARERRYLAALAWGVGMAAAAVLAAALGLWLVLGR